MSGRNTRGLVAVARASSYDPVVIREAVDAVLAPFGGPGEIAGGRRVLVKPNVLRPADPEEAVTTHPAVVRAICEIFLESGFTVSVGDAPGGAPGPAMPAFRRSQIQELTRQLGVPLLNFQKEGSCEVTLPFGPVCKLSVALPVLEADCIINVPKFKTHNLTGLTCALKNPYGYIPGFLKGKLHALAPKPESFSEILCALWQALPPRFSVVDAVVGMEGCGPSAGEPKQVGLILGGTDPVALDTVAAAIMGYDPAALPLLQCAEAYGLGVGPQGSIQTAGASLTGMVVTDFKRPAISLAARLMPHWLARLFSPLLDRITWIRPSFLAEKCERCGRCVQSCPTGALQAEGDRVPVLAAPNDCISCLCCQEVCPARAVELRKSLALRPFLPARREED